ncbi:MAG: hypothetical protein ACYC7J_14295 [Syntrophales bacterium]
MTRDRDAAGDLREQAGTSRKPRTGAGERFWPRLVAAGTWLGNAAIALLAVGVSLFLLGLLPPALVREGYVQECHEAGADYLGMPIWQGRFVGADGQTIPFTSDGRTRWFCYRRGYYGSGSTADYLENTSIRYEHTWGGEWYAITKLSSEGELLAGHGRDRARIRIYYRPLASHGINWVDDFEPADDRQPRSWLSIWWNTFH